MVPIMGVAIMPVPETPARRNRRPGRISHDTARNQADWAADQGARQSAHRAVAKPLLCVRNGRQEGQSCDRSQYRKLLYHPDAPAHMMAIRMDRHGVREAPCAGIVKKVRRGRVLFQACVGKNS